MVLRKGGVYSSTVEAEIIAQAEVLVAGGGTAGVVAAIAVARGGADVMLVERSGVLGGMMTAGNAGMTKYTVHDRSQAEYRKLMGRLATDPASVQIVGGIPMEITRRLIEAGAGIGTHGEAGTYAFTAPEAFKWLLLEMMDEAGVNLLLHSMIVDVILDGATVKGVVIESKSGRQAILADKIVDCTGDGDVAARSGAPFVLGVGPDDLAAKQGTPPGTMQKMGVMFRMGNVDMETCFTFLRAHREHFRPQQFTLMGFKETHESLLRGDMCAVAITEIGTTVQLYNNPAPGVFTFCCPCYQGSGLSNTDLSRGTLEIARIVRGLVKQMKDQLPGFEDAYLMDTPEIGVRETRHIQGEYLLTAEDILSMKEFSDSIGRGGHPVDTHPVPDEIRHCKLPPRWSFAIPYRCLVPRDVDGLLVAGRCFSATHEAFGSARTTVQCMIMGEAAGVAAAMCAREKVQPRDLDVDRLRRQLTENGVIL